MSLIPLLLLRLVRHTSNRNHRSIIIIARALWKLFTILLKHVLKRLIRIIRLKYCRLGANLFEDHFILSQGACLVGNKVLESTKVLWNVGVASHCPYDFFIRVDSE
mgnify:CR=1 FL=1